MLCLTLSTTGQHLGTLGGPAEFIPADAIAIGYVSRVQPTECATTDYVLLTRAEVIQNATSPLRLTWYEAGQISGAILGIWALAWCIKQMARLIRETDVIHHTPE